jgi:hypothetical protein
MNLDNLSIEEKEKLKEYVNSIKEIKKEVNQLLEKAGSKLRDEGSGGNMSTGLTKSLSPKKTSIQ